MSPAFTYPAQLCDTCRHPRARHLSDTTCWEGECRCNKFVPVSDTSSSPAGVPPVRGERAGRPLAPEVPPLRCGPGAATKPTRRGD